MQALAEIKNKQYKKALKFIADAKLFPQNLGVGKPYDENIDERLENWLDYQCYINLKDTETAGKSLQKIITFSPKIDNTVMNFLPANQLVSAWAIEKTSSSQKAAEWLKNQAGLYSSNKIIQWSLEMYTKKQSNILTEDEKDGEVRIIEKL
jgi:tetratricopeptide (TPR) repeat protein